MGVGGAGGLFSGGSLGGNVYIFPADDGIPRKVGTRKRGVYTVYVVNLGNAALILQGGGIPMGRGGGVDRSMICVHIDARHRRRRIFMERSIGQQIGSLLAMQGGGDLGYVEIWREGGPRHRYRGTVGSFLEKPENRSGTWLIDGGWGKDGIGPMHVRWNTEYGEWEKGGFDGWFWD
jgi:hypothetical protein